MVGYSDQRKATYFRSNDNGFLAIIDDVQPLWALYDKDRTQHNSREFHPPWLRAVWSMHLCENSSNSLSNWNKINELQEGCRSITENGSLVDVCCCKGNFCNTRSIWKTYKEQQRSYLEDLHAKEMALLPALTYEPRTPSRNGPHRKLNPFAKISQRVDPDSSRNEWNYGSKKAAAPSVVRPNQYYPIVNRQVQKSTTAFVATTSATAPVWDLPLIDYRQFLTTSTVAPTSTSSVRVYAEPYELGRVNQAAGPVDLLQPPETTAAALPQAVAEMKCFGQQRSQRGPLIHTGIPRTVRIFLN